jgi:hypothetical protein
MGRLSRLALAVIVAAIGQAAHAADSASNIAQMTMGFSYYNRPGASFRDQSDDLTACLSSATRVWTTDELSMGAAGSSPGGVAGALTAGLMVSAYANRHHPSAIAASLENCMVVRGWRVVLLSSDEGQSLARLPQAELSLRLGPWIGADVPHGLVVRSWNNDAVHGSTIRFVARPDSIADGQLSLLAVTGRDLKQFDLRRTGSTAPQPAVDVSNGFAKLRVPLWQPPLEATPAARLSPIPNNLISRPLPPGALPPVDTSGRSGVVVARLTGGRTRNAMLILEREGPDPSRPAGPEDRELKYLILTVQPAFSASVLLVGPYVVTDPSPKILASAVPPGRWRIYGMGALTAPVLNFCLGSPSFEVRPGEVVYAGSFDLNGELGPDLDLAPVRTWLAGRSEVGTIKAADYTNGSLGLCGDNVIDALEIRGAPFASGYVWGGAAAAGPAKGGGR